MDEETFNAIMLKIKSVPDEGYRGVLIEAAIQYRCKQELGHADPCRRLGYAAKARVRFLSEQFRRQLVPGVEHAAFVLGRACAVR